MLQIHTELPSDVEHYDLCLVFPVDYSSSEDGALFETGEMVIEKLVQAIGLKYLYFLRQDNFLSNGICIGTTKSDLHLLVRGGMKLLKSKADTDGTPFLLDGSVARLRAQQGSAPYNVDPFDIPDFPEQCDILPFEYTYVPYDSLAETQDIYWRPIDMSHPFRKNVRIRMLGHFLQGLHNSNIDDVEELSLMNLLKGGGDFELFPSPRRKLSGCIYHRVGPAVHCCVCAARRRH
jgi:hypothetical protein